MSATPVRVQRKRTKGFNLQEASPNGLPVAYVGRRTKYGNPYRIGEIFHGEPLTRKECVRVYELYLRQRLKNEPNFLDELKGKNLACWCPLDKLCHADVLLKVMKERGIN
jgi:hypothetical protein